MRKTTKTTAKQPATRKATKAPKIAATKASRFTGKKLLPSAAGKKANPRRPTAKDRSGKVRPANGFLALEFIRKNPGCTYEQFLAAKLRPADLRWDVKLKRVEVRA